MDEPQQADPVGTRGKPKHSIFTGPVFESHTNLLFFADQLGVHWFNGARWEYQKLYQRNVDQNCFYSGDIHSFCNPQFAEDGQGRIYVWSAWGEFGRTGTIGFWVFDSGKWKNWDLIERIRAVYPRAGGEVWVFSDGGGVSVLKDGKHLVGEEARELLCPNLRFSLASLVATGRDGTAFVRLDEVTVLEPFAKNPHGAVKLSPTGRAIDLGGEAGKFLDRVRSHPIVVDSSGWVWGSRLDGLAPECMSPNGQEIRVVTLNGGLTWCAVECAAPDGKIYVSGSGKLWRFDPQAIDRLDEDRLTLPAMVVKVGGIAYPDSRGRMWCTWDTPEKLTAVFDGQNWQTFPRLTKDSSGQAGFIAAYQGVDGAMIFEDHRHRFHLFDAQGHVTADSAEKLALTYPDRLRTVLPYPPATSDNFYHHLVKDVAGRIWWADWEKPWGVVHGVTALRGENTTLQVGGAHKAVFSVFQPIGDGTRLLAGDERGVSTVLSVQDGHIVVSGDSPVRIGDRPPDNWRRNVLRDSLV